MERDGLLMSALYIAGPMRGVPEFNFPLFRRARCRLREVGYTVTCPAEMDELDGFDPTGMTGYEPLDRLGLDLHTVLRRDVLAVLDADGIGTLPGFEDSRGATAEVALGRALGLRVAPVDRWITDAILAKRAVS